MSCRPIVHAQAAYPRTVRHKAHLFSGFWLVSNEQLYDKTWHGLGITEDPNVLDGQIRHYEDQLTKIFKAVSEVFPSDRFPFDGLDHYRTVRRALDEVDAQLRLRSGPFSG